MGLLALVERVKAGVRLEGNLPLQIPVLGSLPTGRLNAMAVRLPDGNGNVVLFEAGLLTFANLLTKVVAQLCDVQSNQKGVTINVSNDPVHDTIEVERRLMEVIRAKLVGGDPGYAPPYLVSGGTQRLADLLRDSFELFVMGHELGHLHLGHLVGAESVRSAVGNHEVDEVRYSWDQEYAADRFGLGVAMMAGPADPRLHFCGADLFLWGVDLVDRSVAILAYGDERTLPRSSSHPPPDARRHALRQELLLKMPKHAAEHVLAFNDRVVAKVDRLWRGSAYTLYEMRRDGVRPTPRWA